MTKNPNYDYFTLALPKPVNQKLNSVLEENALRRQKALEKVITNWVNTMKSSDSKRVA